MAEDPAFIAASEICLAIKNSWMGTAWLSAPSEWRAEFIKIIAQAMPKWRRIEEYPNNGSMVLLHNTEEFMRPFLGYGYGGKEWHFDNGFKCPAPTHFMPLPSDPEDTND